MHRGEGERDVSADVGIIDFLKGVPRSAATSQGLSAIVPPGNVAYLFMDEWLYMIAVCSEAITEVMIDKHCGYSGSRGALAFHCGEARLGAVGASRRLRGRLRDGDVEQAK